MKEITSLQALLNDVKGNEFLGDAKKMSGYLKSLSLLADALSRRSWQEFEIDVIDELKAVKSNAKMQTALDIKKKLAQREFELAELQVKLMQFHGYAAAGAYITKECAAGSLRKIADDLEKSDSELFPKPWSEEETRAYAKQVGARYVEDNENLEEVLKSLRPVFAPASQNRSSRRKAKAA